MKRPWLSWLLIWLALGVGGGAAAWLLHWQGARTAGALLGAAAAILFVLWMYWGLWQARNYPGMKVLGGYVLAGNLVWLAAYAMWGTPSQGWSIALVGIWGMATLFVFGLWLIRVLLSPGWALTGIARTLIDEAIRMKIALIFIIGMVLMVPILPILLDPAERLDYRLKFFLSWSIGGTSAMLSLMTVLLACSTVCTEIGRKHIYMTMVKPVSRLQYLLGKWLGIILLNLLLIFVAGVGIDAFARVLQMQPVADQAKAYLERNAVANEVLVSRQSARPHPDEKLDFDAEVKERHAKLRRDNPEEYGEKLTAKQLKEIRNRIIARWYAIGPGDSQTYVFHGLQPARASRQPIQFRFKPKMSKIPKDEMVRLGLWINDRPYPMFSGVHYPLVVAVGNYHVIDLDAQYVLPDGSLKIRIANTNLANPDATFPATVSFPPGKGMEVLYRVGGFEGNLVRSLLLLAVRLSFLAILGIMAGTFLGFPVASLLSMMVYFSAIATRYLTESLRYYAGYSTANLDVWHKITVTGGGMLSKLGEGKYWEVIQIIIRLLGEFFLLFVPDFSAYNPTPLVADGRVVTLEMLGGGVIWIGLVSGGACLLIGWFIFSRRELARITV